VAKGRSSLARRILSWVCLILFCLAAPVALAAGWARLTIGDSDAYARTVGAVAGEPVVQAAVVQAVTAQVQTALTGENPTASQVILARTIMDEVTEAIQEVVASAAFRQTWESANRGAHQSLAGQRTAWGQPVTLDLTPLATELQTELATLGVVVPPGVNLSGNLRVQVLDAATADRVRRALQWLDISFMTALAVTVIALVLALILAPDRLALLARAGFGLAVMMAILIALLLIAQGWATSSPTTPGSGALIGAILDAVSQGLRISAIGLALIGLLVAGICAGLRSLQRSLPGRPRYTDVPGTSS
jgi:hypothetical protein